jgi:F0F1-type ATP synthase assembly protein I
VTMVALNLHLDVVTALLIGMVAGYLVGRVATHRRRK